MKGIMPRKWLEGDERELGLVGEGYLQGLIPSEMSVSMPITATERRVVMMGEPAGGGDSGNRADDIYFQISWTCVCGYWQGMMPLPPERWRDGPEAEMLVLVLEPESAGGKDVVIRSNLVSWVDHCRTIGIPEIVD